MKKSKIDKDIDQLLEKRRTSIRNRVYSLLESIGVKPKTKDIKITTTRPDEQPKPKQFTFGGKK